MLIFYILIVKFLTGGKVKISFYLSLIFDNIFIDSEEEFFFTFTKKYFDIPDQFRAKTWL
jgi:hypothetical protein